MDAEFKYLTEIENYLSEDASKETKLNFEKQLSNNEALAQEFSLYQNIMGGIDLEGTDLMREELKGIQKKLEKENYFDQTKTTSKVVKMKTEKKSNRNWLAIAASLLLLVGTALFLFQSPDKMTRTEALAKFDHSKKSKELLTQQINEYEGLGMADPERGKKDSIAQMLHQYEAGSYQESYNAATELLARYPDDMVARYYAGMSKFQAGDYGKAVELLNATIQEKEAVFYDQARWYLALSYTMLDNSDSDAKATKLMQQIIDAPVSNFKTEATWHLEFLNKDKDK